MTVEEVVRSFGMENITAAMVAHKNRQMSNEKEKFEQLEKELKCEKEKVEKLLNELSVEKEKVVMFENALQIEKEKVGQLASELQVEREKVKLSVKPQQMCAIATHSFEVRFCCQIASIQNTVYIHSPNIPDIINKPHQWIYCRRLLVEHSNSIMTPKPNSHPSFNATNH